MYKGVMLEDLCNELRFLLNCGASCHSEENIGDCCRELITRLKDGIKKHEAAIVAALCEELLVLRNRVKEVSLHKEINKVILMGRHAVATLVAQTDSSSLGTETA